LEFLRPQAEVFFSPRPTVLVGEDEDLLLDCYRLAHYYHCDPRIFLEMPLSEVETHMRHTIRIAELEHEAIERETRNA
jgi:hypothetical protein